MSLLMDALKKAERNRPGTAKADDTSDELARALAESPIEVPPAPVRAARPAPARPANNFSERDPLSLVLADDAPSAAAASVASPTPAAAATPRRTTRVVVPPAESGALVRDERQAAANVFSVKAAPASTRHAAKPRNPKGGFYAVLGVLTLAALGIVGYFYWQITGGSGLGGGTLASSGAAQPGVSGTVAPPPPAPPSATPVEISVPPAPPAAPAATAAASTEPAVPAGTKLSQPPVAAAKPAPARQPVLLAGPGASGPVLGAVAAKPAVAGVATLAPATQIKITRSANQPTVHNGVSEGYEALRQGKLEVAERGYRSALEVDRTNRDALLGLATVMQRTSRNSDAERVYARLVELDPEDADAHAGLLGLRQARAPADQGRDESRLKSLISRDQRNESRSATPSAAASHLALGNQLAAQGRWPEAQQAYFAAHSSDPSSADILYNLAVSLDQLGQRRLASDYYEKAAGAAQTRGAQFDLTRARARAAQLAAPAVTAPTSTPSTPGTPAAGPQ